MVNALLAQKHEVTLFNRGKRNPHLFPTLETLIGDRDPDKDQGIKALEGRAFDAVVDSSGHYPRHVRASAELLRKNGLKQYTFISSIGVHPLELFNKPGLDETAAVIKLADPSVETMGENSENYGGLKALCERAVTDVMGADKTLVIRPGLISGPGDWSDRYTYWPVRIDRGGEVLAPDCPESPVQYIDVRDLAEWTVTMVQANRAGTFNATGPAHLLSWTAFLYGIRGATTSDARFTFVDERFLEAQGVAPWQQLPLWVPTDSPNKCFLMVSIDRALKAGLTFRPVAVTAIDTIRWNTNDRPKDHPAPPDCRQRRKQRCSRRGGRGKIDSCSRNRSNPAGLAGR